jgi:hypothetical protein
MQILRLISHVFADLVARIRAINQRYRTPRLAMSPAVRLSLLALRLYLLLLVALLGYKFVTLVIH